MQCFKIIEIYTTRIGLRRKIGLDDGTFWPGETGIKQNENGFYTNLHPNRTCTASPHCGISNRVHLIQVLDTEYVLQIKFSIAYKKVFPVITLYFIEIKNSRLLRIIRNWHILVNLPAISFGVMQISHLIHPSKFTRTNMIYKRRKIS